jgi:hypothetical protein
VGVAVSSSVLGVVAHLLRTLGPTYTAGESSGTGVAGLGGVYDEWGSIAEVAEAGRGGGGKMRVLGSGASEG